MFGYRSEHMFGCQAAYAAARGALVCADIAGAGRLAPDHGDRERDPGLVLRPGPDRRPRGCRRTGRGDGRRGRRRARRRRDDGPAGRANPRRRRDRAGGPRGAGPARARRGPHLDRHVPRRGRRRRARRGCRSRERPHRPLRPAPPGGRRRARCRAGPDTPGPRAEAGAGRPLHGRVRRHHGRARDAWLRARRAPGSGARRSWWTRAWGSARTRTRTSRRSAACRSCARWAIRCCSPRRTRR